MPGSISARVRERLTTFHARLTERLGFTPGSQSYRFASHVATLISADALATVLTFGISAWAIRTIGPSEFGVVNLVVSVSQLLLAPGIWGFHAGLSRHVAASREPGTYLSTGIGLGLLLCVGVSVAGFAFEPLLQPASTVTLRIYRWSLVYVVALGSQALVQSSLAGFREFVTVGKINVYSAILFAAATAMWLLSGQAMTGDQFIALNMARWLAFTLLGLMALRHRFERPSLVAAKHLFHFGTYYALSTAVGFFVLSSMDNLMLNAFLGPAAVGLYGAYYAAFNIFSSRVLGIVSGVLIPTAAAHDDPVRLRRRLTSAYLRVGWLIVPGISFLTWILFTFYGRAYTFEWPTTLMMAFSVYLYTAVGTLATLMAAEGVRGMRLSMTLIVVAAVSNVGLNWLLIPSLGIRGCIAASIATSLIQIWLRDAAFEGRWPFATRPV